VGEPTPRERAKKLHADFLHGMDYELSPIAQKAIANEIRAAVAAEREKMDRVRLRLGCIARVSANHASHVCPADDCLECWPGDVVEEFAKFAAVRRGDDAGREDD